MKKQSENIIMGLAEIAKFIGVGTEEKAADFIRLGLPARKINGRWYAHRGNIDKWFESQTRRPDKRDVVNPV